MIFLVPKKVLITGGAGFLGLHCARYFSRKKWDVVIADIMSPNLKEYPKQTVNLTVDIRDRAKFTKSLRNVDVVIHAAAALPLWSAKEIYSTNIKGTKNVLEACVANQVSRVIYISSTAVYGIPKKHPIYESDPVYGVGPYGESKIAAEALCTKYQDRGLTVSIIRPKTFVGTHRLGVFEILFDWIRDGRRIPVVGRGLNRYQLLEVEDLCAALYLLATHKNKKQVNDVFNIGAAQFDTVGRDLGALFKYAKSGSKIFPTPAWLVKKTLFILEKLRLSPLYQWVYETADQDSYVSIDKLTKTLKWKPKYSNSQALIRSYQWYLDNFDEVKSRTPGVTHTVGWNQGILGFFKRFM